ncbi:MAG: hypothetical protein ACP5KN_03530 [Armatimonadota bacterium]
MAAQQRGRLVVRLCVAAVAGAVVVACLAAPGCRRPAAGPGDEIPAVGTPPADMPPGAEEPLVEEPEGRKAAEAEEPTSERPAREAPATETGEAAEASPQSRAPAPAAGAERMTGADDAPPAGEGERPAFRERPQATAAEGAGFRERRGGRRGERLFEQYDANDDGALSQEELPEELAERVMRADADGDGRVSRDELMQFRPRARGERRGGVPGAQGEEDGR